MTIVQLIFEEWKNLNRLEFDEFMLNQEKTLLREEREQHGDTWDAALSKYEVRAGNYSRAFTDFDDYYLENFKTD